jgi:hypothetical protein
VTGWTNQFRKRSRIVPRTAADIQHRTAWSDLQLCKMSVFWKPGPAPTHSVGPDAGQTTRGRRSGLRW